MADGDAISNSEFVMRRISVKSNHVVSIIPPIALPEAFRPFDRDTTGLSVSRTKSEAHPDFKSPEQFATGPSDRGYFVAILSVGDLRAANIEVVPCPVPDDPGHSELPRIRYELRRTDQCLNYMEKLGSELILRIEGPFRAAANV